MYNQKHTNKTFFENHFLLELAVERREQNDKILDNAIHLIFFLIKNFQKKIFVSKIEKILNLSFKQIFL